MSKTITIRLGKELAAWLEDAAARTGVSQGKIVREQLERARAGGSQPFLRLAGRHRGPRDLSSRKGFARGERDRGHRVPGRLRQPDRSASRMGRPRGRAGDRAALYVR